MKERNDFKIRGSHRFERKEDVGGEVAFEGFGIIAVYSKKRHFVFSLVSGKSRFLDKVKASLRLGFPAAEDCSISLAKSQSL